MYTREELLKHPSLASATGGVYGIWFQDLDSLVRDGHLVRRNGFSLLYVGISSKKSSEKGGLEGLGSLHNQIGLHYAGDASNSILRRALGCMLADRLGIGLRRVGPRRRLTFGEDEKKLSVWMEAKALVSWMEHEQPQELESELIANLNLPLNIRSSGRHDELLGHCEALANVLPILPISLGKGFELSTDASPIHSIAFSPYAAVLASAGSDGAVRLWDIAAGRERVSLTGHRGPVLSVAFSTYAAVLASAGSDGAVRLWDIAAGQERVALTGHGGPVQSVAFSPGGAVLASAGDDCMVRLWNPRTGQQVAEFAGHTDWVRSVAFSPDGAILASAGDDCMVRLWNPRTGQQVAEFAGHTDWVGSVAFSPDGAVLASAGDDCMVRLWNPRTGQQVAEFAGHTDWV